MGDQSRRTNSPRGDQVEEPFHVALLGPAHVTDRVVDAILLVRRVVPAGAVRARQPQLQLFFVVGVARHIHADHADRYDHGPVARQGGRDLHGIARAGRGGDQDRIGAAPQAEVFHALEEIRVGAQARVVGAIGPSQIDLVRCYVDAEDPTASRFEQLDRQLTNEAEANDDARFANSDIRDAHPLERNGADGDERGVVQGDAVGHAHRQVRGDRDDLGWPAPAHATRSPFVNFCRAAAPTSSTVPAQL